MTIRYKFKAFTVKYSLMYHNQLGQWNFETCKLEYNHRFKTLCGDCSLEYTFRYKISENCFISKKQFLKRFSSLHKRCDECHTSLFFLKICQT